MNIGCFLYHRIVNDREDVYTHSPKVFDQHLNIMANTGIKISSITSLNLDDNQTLLISTDDGYTSDLYVADKLEKLNTKGHFFIITSLVGTPGYLTIQDIRELHNRGHIVGSHTHNHITPFTKLSLSQMEEEWRTSLNLLNSWLGTKTICGSIPGGAKNSRVEQAAERQGIRFLFTSEPTKSPWWYKNMLCIGRVCPKRGTNLKRIEQLATLKGFAREQLTRNLKVLLKKALVWE